MIKTYVINLPKSIDRLARISQNLKDINLDFEVIKGVVGSELKLPHKDFSRLGYSLMHGKKPNLGEIGCYLSHIRALRMFLTTNKNHALILEDDVILDKDLIQILQAAIHENQHWDMLRCSGLHRGTPICIKKIFNKYCLAVNLTRQTGGAYVVNRKAAELLINHLLPMKLPFDHAYDREWLLGFKTLSLDPYPIKQLQTDSNIWSHGFTKFIFLFRIPTYLYRIINETTKVIYRVTILLIIKLKFRGRF